jgi:hypothetical protein
VGFLSAPERGHFVARKRPTASDVTEPTLTCLDGGRSTPDGPPLTRAEARALRRSTPLTHAQLWEHLMGPPEPPQQSA